MHFGSKLDAPQPLAQRGCRGYGRLHMVVAVARRTRPCCVSGAFPASRILTKLCAPWWNRGTTNSRSRKKLPPSRLAGAGSWSRGRSRWRMTFAARRPCRRDTKRLPRGLSQPSTTVPIAPLKEACRSWIAKLGDIRSARFFVLGGGTCGTKLPAPRKRPLNYRVGVWKQTWRGEFLSEFESLEETLVTSSPPLFRDVTAAFFDRANRSRTTSARNAVLARAPGPGLWHRSLRRTGDRGCRHRWRRLG